MTETNSALVGKVASIYRMTYRKLTNTPFQLMDAPFQLTDIKKMDEKINPLTFYTG